MIHIRTPEPFVDALLTVIRERQPTAVYLGKKQADLITKYLESVNGTGRTPRELTKFRVDRKNHSIGGAQVILVDLPSHVGVLVPALAFDKRKEEFLAWLRGKGKAVSERAGSTSALEDLRLAFGGGVEAQAKGTV